jgi:DNA-binding CsgD family transcriptional regulator
MIELWKRLLDRLRIRRSPRRGYFALEESLHTATELRAVQQQRRQEDVQAELVSAALAQLEADDWMQECWGRLSPREKDITALTCLKYTNRQIAERMQLSPNTIKSYLVRVLFKFHVHSKAELRQALTNWSFSDWGKPQS